MTGIEDVDANRSGGTEHNLSAGTENNLSSGTERNSSTGTEHNLGTISNGHNDMARSTPEDGEKLGSEAEDSEAEDSAAETGDEKDDEKGGEDMGNNSDLENMAGEQPEDRGERDEELALENDDGEGNDESDVEMHRGNSTKKGTNSGTNYKALGKKAVGKAALAAKVAEESGLDVGNPIRKRKARDQWVSTIDQEADDENSIGDSAPAKKEKRPTTKEIQAKKPRLDLDVLMDQRLSDRELLAIAKNPKPYERHTAAPYAFKGLEMTV